MTVVNSGGVPNTTANVAHKLLVAWVDSANTALVGAQGQNIPLAQGGVALSAGANSQSSGTINFSNANGVTFGMDGAGNITATVIPGAAAGIAAIQLSNTTYTSGTVLFSNANGFSFGSSAGGAITGSYTVPTQSVQTQASGAIAGTGFTSTTTAGVVIVGTNATNGLSLGIPNYITTYVGQSTQTQPAGSIAGAGTTTTTQGGSTLGATQNSNGLSLAVPLWLTTYVGQTTQTQPAGNIAGVGTTFAGVNVSGSMTLNSVGLNLSLSAGPGGGGGFTGGVSTGGNTLGNTGTQTGSLIFVGGNNITLSVGTAAGGAQTGISSIIVSNTTYTSGAVSFSNANGISFGSSAGQAITASYTVPTQSVQGQTLTVSAANTSYTVPSLSFSNANNVSFSLSNNSQVYATASFAQSAQPVAVSGSNGSFAFSTLTLGNLNGLSHYTSNGSVVASYTVPVVTNSSWTVSDANTSGSVALLAFTQSNGLTLSLSTSNNGHHTVVGSYTVPSTAGLISGMQLSAGGGTSNTAVTGLTFANSNNFTFGLSTGAGVGTITGSYTVPTVTQYFSNTATTFNGANISGSITHNTAGLQLSLSVAAAGGVSTGQYYALGNTTQNSSTTLALSAQSFNALGAMTWGYSNGSIQVSAPATSSISGTGLVSISVNASTISIGVAGTTASIWAPAYAGSQTPNQIGNGTIQVAPAMWNANVSASRADVLVSISGSTIALSTYAGTISIYVGLYSRNASTLSLASSGSQSYTWTNSSNNNTTAYTGLRNLSVPLNVNAGPQDLWIAIMSQTASANTNAWTGSNMVFGGNGAVLAGLLGSSAPASQQSVLGLGVYSVSSAALPASMAFSGINGTASGAMYPPVIVFHNVSA